MSDYGSECKDIGAKYILTAEHCKLAAESLQLSWKRPTTNSRQKGCIKYSDKTVYLNQAAQSGSGDGGVSSICLKGIL